MVEVMKGYMQGKIWIFGNQWRQAASLLPLAPVTCATAISLFSLIDFTLIVLHLAFFRQLVLRRKNCAHIFHCLVTSILKIPDACQ